MSDTKGRKPHISFDTSPAQKNAVHVTRVETQVIPGSHGWIEDSPREFESDVVATVPKGLSFLNSDAMRMAPEPQAAQAREGDAVFSEIFAAASVLRAREFVQRNAMALTICLAFCLTFALGIMTTIAFIGGPEQTLATADPRAPEPDVARENQDVTRKGQSSLLEVTQTQAVPVDDPTGALAAAILLGLTPKHTVGKLTEAEAALALKQAQSILSENKLRMMREGVLGGVYRIEATTEGTQKRVKLHTLNAAVTKDIIADILRRAAAAGQIEIPASLNTAEGDVDMDTMLFNLVQTSLANDGTSEGAEAAREMSRKAFAASSAKTRAIKGERVYVVERGDSLAYISLQFYGKPSDYARIFDANRDVLESPDKIQIGQRLKIPT